MCTWNYLKLNNLIYKKHAGNSLEATLHEEKDRGEGTVEEKNLETIKDLYIILCT